MSLVRIDAPSTCGCNPEWVDTPSGPKAKCSCSGEGAHGAEAPAQKSLLDAANERAEAERREAGKAGPPKGAHVRAQTDGFDPTKAGPPGGAFIERTLRVQSEGFDSTKAGPPLGAVLKRGAPRVEDEPGANVPNEVSDHRGDARGSLVSWLD